MKKDALNWFELYVSDFARAQRFYETILACNLVVNDQGTMKMGMFPSDQQNGVGGAITQMDGFGPGPGGTLIYLNVEGELDAVISRIGPAGGHVIKPRFSIAPYGFIAIFQDTEGNVVGLHSMT